jgi:uncharacterized protein YecE (DUF72 family)
MNPRIHIGTSGWSYRHWKPGFYPQKLPSSKWLSFYAETFDTTEINGSFYRLPTMDHVLAWAAAVPENFIFCPKMSRYLTHMKKLLDPEEPLLRFFDVFDTIKEKLGPVLLQLPPFLKFNAERVSHLFNLLRKNYGDYDFALEVRHDSWLEKESLALMKKHDIGLVISQSENEFPYSEAVTAKTVYLRLHGPKELYASSYSDEMLESFAGKIKKWVKGRHEVWVFFNNDIHGFAVGDAVRLRNLLKK